MPATGTPDDMSTRRSVAVRPRLSWSSTARTLTDFGRPPGRVIETGSPAAAGWVLARWYGPPSTETS